MSVAFYILIWVYALDVPNKVTENKQYVFNHRFEKLTECEEVKKYAINKLPKENSLRKDGSEVKYSDFYCLGVPEGRKPPPPAPEVKSEKPAPLPPPKPAEKAMPTAKKKVVLPPIPPAPPLPAIKPSNHGSSPPSAPAGSKKN